jgi:hypothetical protein
MLHIPQETKIGLYFKAGEGKLDRPRVETYLEVGILSQDLEQIADIKEAIRLYHDKALSDNTIGQYVGSISNLLGKIRDRWHNPPEGVNPEEHKRLTDALVSFDRCKELAQRYATEGARMRKPADTRRKEGESGPREKHHDWDDIKQKEAAHTREMSELLLNRNIKATERTKVRNGYIFASLVRMENTRSGLATVKVRNIDLAVDNYISFSEEEYGDSIVVWNSRKHDQRTNSKRYNQILPKDLADILKRYVDELHTRFHMDQDYLFPFDVSPVYVKDDPKKGHKKGDPKPPNEIMDARKSQFVKIIPSLTKDLLGASIGESDMRRIQVTYMGLPDTEAELCKLALKFHHTANEHRLYFRTAHKRPIESHAGPSSKKQRGDIVSENETEIEE